MDDDDAGWYAVRCLVDNGWPPGENGRTYEERITLWRAASAEDAIARAETEAFAYAAAIEDHPGQYLGLAQSFRLFDEPADGAEVFSLMRDSHLEPEAFLDTFFATGTEHQVELENQAP